MGKWNMKKSKRFLNLSLLVMALSGLILPNMAGAVVQENSPKDDPRMRKVRRSLLPYTQKISEEESVTLWQYRDPQTGMVSDLMPKRLIVGFDTSSPMSVQRAALERTGAVISATESPEILKDYGIYVLDVPQAESVQDLTEVQETIAARQGVEFVAFDQAKRIALTPNDPRLGQQEHHDVISSELAWDIQAGQLPDEDVVLVVIDSGIDYNHEDLSDSIWINTEEIPDNGLDDDGLDISF